MEVFFSAIANFGFPVVVAAYLLFRFEGKVDALTKAISGRNGLVDKLEKIEEEICKK